MLSLNGLRSGFVGSAGFCILSLVGLLGSASTASAQTTAFTLGWDQPVTAPQTIADVNAYVYTLKINTGTGAQTPQTCVAGTPIKCTTPLPATIKSGDVVTLTATNGFGSGSGSTTVPGGAAAPVNVTIIVKVTVP